MLESLFNKVVNKLIKLINFIKKRLQHRCFPVKCMKFLRTPILKNICKRLLLWIESAMIRNNDKFRLIFCKKIYCERPFFRNIFRFFKKTDNHWFSGAFRGYKMETSVRNGSIKYSKNLKFSASQGYIAIPMSTLNAAILSIWFIPFRRLEIHTSWTARRWKLRPDVVLYLTSWLCHWT